MSALGWRELAAPGPGAREPLVALAGAACDLERLVEGLERRFRVVLLAAPRRANPRGFGLPAPGGDWYVGDDAAPDPLGFGLCLEQLERFLVDDAARLARRPILLGVGQGASLALALARCWPERLAGVVALGGAWPELPGGALEERPLAGLRCALAPASGAGSDLARADRAAAALRARGARVHRVAAGAIAEALDAVARRAREVGRGAQRAIAPTSGCDGSPGSSTSSMRTPSGSST